MFTLPGPILYLPALVVALTASDHCFRTADKVREDKKKLAELKVAGLALHGNLGPGDVVVATIKKASSSGVTLATPARVELEVHEVLRGNPKLARRQSLWRMPPPVRLCGYGMDFLKQSFLEHLVTFPVPVGGEKVILCGAFEKSKREKVFVVDASLVYPFHDARRQWAVALIKEIDRKHLEETKRLEAKAKAEREAREQWRGRVDAKDIARFVEKAEFVGFGKLIGETGPDFEITQIVKGRKLTTFTDDKYYVETPLPKGILELLDRDTPYALFLMEKGLVPGRAAPHYFPIPNGDGIVIADPACREAVMRALKR